VSVIVKINGQELEAAGGQTILQVAQENGIEIPNLCYDPELKPEGACRMCVVEVEDSGQLVTACTTEVSEDLVVNTESEKVVRMRKLLLELLLANHEQECLTCDKAGACNLQDYAYKYDLEDSRFKGRMRKYEGIVSDNPFFIRDNEKCILCRKCVNICDQVQREAAIGFEDRGFETTVTTAFDRPLEEVNCQFCGMCLNACPTGALMEKDAMGKARNWELDKVETTCPYCGVGCQLELNVKDNEIVKVTTNRDNVNRGQTCVKGKFGLDFVTNEDRLTKPLMKVDGEFKEVSWDEAFDTVAKRFGKIKEEYGGEAAAGLSSAKCTNEENYLMQKFMRAVMGTNTVDHCARLCHSSTVAGLAKSFGSGAMTNSINEIENADTIFVTGSNTTEAHPVIALRVKKAQKNGGKLVVADPRKIDLVKYADLWLQHKPGTDVALLNGLMHVIIRDGLLDEEYIENRTENFSAVEDIVEKYTPEYVSEITTVPAEDIVKAAHMYGEAERASILYAMGITQHTSGTDNVLSIACLAMLTGNVGKESTGVNPLRGQNNVQGACDLGALPNVYPGYQAVDDPEINKKFEEAWGVELSDEVGYTVTEIFDAIEEDKVKALYVMGENPVLSDPDSNHIREALEDAEFVVVQDIFMSETAEYADVILPAASFAEKDGTFTNSERKVQRVRKAIDPVGETKADWEIFTELANRMGYDWDYNHPSEITDEIASVSPIYGGIRYDRIEEDGLQWPCLDYDHSGTMYLHEGEFARGLGQFNPAEYMPPQEEPDKDYPYVLTTGRRLFHFHTGTMSRNAEALDAHYPEELMEMNIADAEKLGVGEGDKVKVSSRRGTVESKVTISERVPEGLVFMSFHFAESAANVLTNPALDPVAKIPEYKVCAINIEKVS